MAGHILNLGGALFSVSTAALNSLARQSSFSWVTKERINRRPALEYTGRGEESISLEGHIYPHFEPYGNGQVVGIRQLDKFYQMAEQGVPFDLVTGDGRALGLFCILSIHEEQAVFFDNGAFRSQAFSMELAYYAEDDGPSAGVVDNGLIDLQEWRQRFEGVGLTTLFA